MCWEIYRKWVFCALGVSYFSNFFHCKDVEIDMCESKSFIVRWAHVSFFLKLKYVFIMLWVLIVVLFLPDTDSEPGQYLKLSTDEKREFVAQLSDAFWYLHANRPSNSLTAPACMPGTVPSYLIWLNCASWAFTRNLTKLINADINRQTCATE